MIFNAHHRTHYLLSDVTRSVTSCLAARLLVWVFVSAICPLPTWATTLYSFQLEVLHDITTTALPPGAPCVTLAERVLARLEQSEAKESDPWLRDDIRIAWIATLYAAQGNPQPLIDATYRVLGLHPDKVWPAIVARRAALLGLTEQNRLQTARAGESQAISLLQPIGSAARYLDLPHKQRKPMAVSRDGDAPQKTCAYGAVSDQHTGTSCSTETKREARRTHASEFGHDAPPAGVAAPADKKRVLEFPAPRKKAA